MAAGIYEPDGGLNRNATFQLVSGITIYGGFFGNEDPATFDPDDRDLISNVSILDGDLRGNDMGLPTDLGDTSRDENIYHVVTQCVGMRLTIN